MRDIPVGNGSFLVTFDEQYQIRDIYFPHVGQENHTEGFPSKFGIWIDGEFSWVSEDSWQRKIEYEKDTLITHVKLTNSKLGIELISRDTISNQENVFLRHILARNTFDKARDLRVFLHQDFRIYENKVGDTAFFDPESFALIHYKKSRYFLINTKPHFDSFATGRKAFGDKEGTWRDAEDGELYGSTITEGSVDSTICVNLPLDSEGTNEFYYWIAAGTHLSEVSRLNDFVRDESPARILEYERSSSLSLVNKNIREYGDLDKEIIDLYKRSILIVRTQLDNGGAILAANDSDVTERATDHYSYLWTRDGALIANALDLSGFPFFTRPFFKLCSQIVHPDGYFLQKYNPDGTVASGWHAFWDRQTKEKLMPIQEDETGLVLWALWEHYERYRELEFVRSLYDSLISPCGDFLDSFRDESGLPLPSWNLWEDRRGVHTFTCATVVGGLRAAAQFALLFGDDKRAIRFSTAAEEVVNEMGKRLYNEEHGRFLRALNANNGGAYEADFSLDASLFGLFYFGAFSVDDPKVAGTMKQVEEKLTVAGNIGGLARFENDGYMRVSDEYIGNPWVICTLWLAEYKIASAKSIEELGFVKVYFRWCLENALPSGVLAEQIHPETGAPISVSPLTWSHSTLVATIESYLEKYEKLKN